VLFVATVVACFSNEFLERAPVTVSTNTRTSGASNVLLIVLDTVRAESLSLYGYDRDTSPNLRRYAARGVRFDRAFSTAPWTAPSHASMFTGRWCHELSVGWNRPLDGSCPTLAGFLAGRGYDTAGFVANTTYCSYETGLARGFARYDDYDVSLRAILLCSSLVQRVVNFTHKHPTLARLVGEDRPTSGHRKSAERINRNFLEWLSSRSGTPERPFFAFLNYYDAHHPYLSPERDDPGPFGARPESGDDLRMLRSWWEFDKRKLDRRGVELVRDSYDRCIAYLDRHVGKVLDELDRRGVLSSTLVVITADHGEHLGEQHLFGHGCSLYRPELHVPLLVITPNGEARGRVVSTPVSLRDLPATVVDVLGIGDYSRSPFPGQSLARTWSGSTEPALLGEPPVLSEVEAAPEFDPNHGTSPARLGPMRSLVGWGFHYIRNGDGREELFNLEGDPGERLDLSTRRDAEVTLARFRDYLPR
jgi:arylsulfatase A-like enzyme